MRTYTTLLRSVIASGAACLVAACGQDGPTTPAPAVAEVTITSEAPTLTAIRDTVSLSATAVDDGRKPIAGAEFIWESSDTSIVDVSNDGVVVAKNNGQAVVTARVGSFSDYVKVIVAQRAASLAFWAQPTSHLAGRPMPSHVVVAIVDANGVPVLTPLSGSVTVTLAPVGTLGGTTTTAPVQGEADFADLVVPAPGHGYSLRASFGDLAPVVSGVFDAYIPFTSVSAGGVHACGLTADGVAYCWGDNATGRVGDGTTTNRFLPVPVASTQRFAAVHAGSPETWARTADGKAYFWGGNITVPTAFAPDYTFASLATRWDSCGITDVGLGYCWGNTPTPILEGHTLTVIATGEQNTCGIDTDGAAWCVGSNPFGELGNGTTTSTSTPTSVAGGLRFTTVGLGEEHACGLTTDGLAYCWGHNDRGQLGVPSAALSTVPVAVSGDHHFTTISVGAWHTCGLEADGGAYCWGSNLTGTLGDGSLVASNDTPVRVAGDHAFVTISAGAYLTCGIAADDLTYCWGFNKNGSLGNGTIFSAFTPALVAGPDLSAATASGP